MAFTDITDISTFVTNQSTLGSILSHPPLQKPYTLGFLLIFYNFYFIFKCPKRKNNTIQIAPTTYIVLLILS